MARKARFNFKGKFAKRLARNGYDGNAGKPFAVVGVVKFIGDPAFKRRRSGSIFKEWAVGRRRAGTNEKRGRHGHRNEAGADQGSPQAARQRRGAEAARSIEPPMDLPSIRMPVTATLPAT